MGLYRTRSTVPIASLSAQTSCTIGCTVRTPSRVSERQSKGFWATYCPSTRISGNQWDARSSIVLNRYRGYVIISGATAKHDSSMEFLLSLRLSERDHIGCKFRKRRGQFCCVAYDLLYARLGSDAFASPSRYGSLRSRP